MRGPFYTSVRKPRFPKSHARAYTQTRGARRSDRSTSGIPRCAHHATVILTPSGTGRLRSLSPHLLSPYSHFVIAFISQINGLPDHTRLSCAPRLSFDSSCRQSGHGCIAHSRRPAARCHARSLVGRDPRFNRHKKRAGLCCVVALFIKNDALETSP